MILLEAEDMWEVSAEARSLAARGLDADDYRRIRDGFKARRIYDLYGYDYFLRFVDKCPHISDLIKEYLPCDRLPGAQCTMFCNFYEGGCKNATE